MAAAYPDVFDFKNIVVTPMQHVLEGRGKTHVGGPNWPDWSKSATYRVFRGLSPVDTPPSFAKSEETITERSFWIGPIVNHFGHAIADFYTRILPALAACEQCPLVFAAHRQRPLASFEDSPPLFKAILEWYRICPQRVHIVNTPTLFRELATVAQPERSGHYLSTPHPEYLVALTQQAHDRFGPPRRRGTVFVSRANFSARFAGEGYLESCLAAAGARTLRPETEPLQEQLREYWHAGKLIFSEGSALHGLQLLGADLPEVTVLGRRAKGNWWSMQRPVWARTYRPRYVQIARNNFTPVDSTGREVLAAAMSEIDVAALHAGLRADGIDIGPYWHQDTFDQASAIDLDEFIRQEILAWIKQSPKTIPNIFVALRRSRISNAHKVGGILSADAASLYRRARIWELQKKARETYHSALRVPLRRAERHTRQLFDYYSKNATQ